MKHWSDYSIQTVNIKDNNYPGLLKKLSNPPRRLFFRGSLEEKIFRKSLAIVGSRRMTQYGKMVVGKFVPALVAQKVTIVSGFMYGVDTQAHKECLECGGKTVAVLGCGLNVVYPPENEKLYLRILETGGLVISEYEPETKPQLWTFPQRNRIVAGLSTLGVLVVEAGGKSGALITARFAKEQGKRLFCVPGPITSSVSVGTNTLIKNHQAKMVLTPDDIIGRKIETPSLFSSIELSPLERKIYQALEREPLTVDELARAINKNVAETGEILSVMAIKGLICETVGKYYLGVSN